MIKKWVPIIGIGIFIYILLKLDFGKVIEEIINAKISWMLIAFFFISISLITQTLKWWVIAKIQKTEVSFIESVKINLISNFYGFITPARIGGITRANYLKKYNSGKIGKGVSNFMLDKILDIVSLIILVILFSFIFKEVLPMSYIYYPIALLFTISIFLLIFTDENKSKKILKLFYIFIPGKIKEKARKTFYLSYEGMPKRKYFVLFFFLNIINWVILLAPSYFVGMAIGMNVPFIYFLAILPIATLVSQIPITISGLGTREAALISLFGLFGIESTKVFSMSLISLILGLIPVIIGWILTFKYKME